MGSAVGESYVRSEVDGQSFLRGEAGAPPLAAKISGPTFPWFASEKAEQGALRFCRVQIDAHKNRWTALAVGDCALCRSMTSVKGCGCSKCFPYRNLRNHDEPLSDRLEVGRRY